MVPIHFGTFRLGREPMEGAGAAVDGRGEEAEYQGTGNGSGRGRDVAPFATQLHPMSHDY